MLSHGILADTQKLSSAIFTTPANAGIALNYRSAGTTTYWVAGIDAADNTAKLWRYNGATLITEHSVSLGVLLNYSTWYRLVVTVTDIGGGTIVIAMSVALASTPGSPLVAFTVGTTQYGTPDGKYGIATDRAAATFDYWRIV